MMQFLLAATLQATNPAATPAPNSGAAVDPDRQICRRIAATGSRTGGTRVCRTAAEWARGVETQAGLDKAAQASANIR